MRSAALLLSLIACTADAPQANVSAARLQPGGTPAEWMGGGFYADDTQVQLIDTPDGPRGVMRDAWIPTVIHLFTWDERGPVTEKQLLSPDMVGDLLAVDLNHDGLRDAVWTTATGRLMWLNARSRTPAQLGTVPVGASPVAADLDGDGRVELVLNTGALEVWGAAGLLRVLGTGLGDPRWAAQLDADPALELVTRVPSGFQVVDSATGALEAVSVPPGRPELQGVGDVDQDGVSELFWGAAAPAGAWSLTGEQRWSTAGECRGAQVADADGDGVIDVLCIEPVAPQRYDAVARDPASGTERARTPVGEENGYLGVPPQLGDLNGDGVPELYGLGLTRATWDGAVTPEVRERGPNWYCRPLLVDLNGDGEVEAVWARDENGGGEVQLVATDLVTHRDLASGPLASTHTLADDHDGDGLAEVLTWTVDRVGTTTLTWQRPDGAGGWSEVAALTLPGMAVHATAQLDGALALFATRADGHLLRLDAAGAVVWDIALATRYAEVGDADGDGQTDLLVEGDAVVSAATGALDAPPPPGGWPISPTAPAQARPTAQGVEVSRWLNGVWTSTTTPNPAGFDVDAVYVFGDSVLVRGTDQSYFPALWRINLHTSRIDWSARQGVFWTGEPAAADGVLVYPTELGLAVYR